MNAEKEKTTMQKVESDQSSSIERTRAGKVFLPAVDIFESAEEIIVTADMPGTSEKLIDITLEHNVLTIAAKVEPLKMSGFDLEYNEFEMGDYQRSFNLTDVIDRDNINATYVNGVLTLKLPKIEPAKPKKIEVKIG